MHLKKLKRLIIGRAMPPSPPAIKKETHHPCTSKAETPNTFLILIYWSFCLSIDIDFAAYL